VTDRLSQWRYAAVLVLLVAMHFTIPELTGEERAAPDFLLLALILFAVHARPGAAAVAGFVVGLVADSLMPAAFGAGALAYTLVGYLTAWGKAVFFAENVAVNVVFVFVGVWMRDVIVLAAGRPPDDAVLLWQLGFWSPIKSIVTAAAGAVVLVVFRRWLPGRAAV
jgi:rod shape-determining protein MreD